jgi:NADH-quinone oxidoreductase subunit N
LAVLGLTISEFNSTELLQQHDCCSKFSTSFSCLFIVLTIFLVALGHNFENHQSKISDFIAISILLVLLRWFLWNLAMFFLGIEVLSIALYILAASDRMN